jgi:hypothetical protein
MKKNLIGLFLALSLVSLPLAAIAGENGMEGMQGHDMRETNGMIVLGTQTVDGVKGMAHLMKNTGSMDKMKMTYHFMLVCSDTNSGAFLSDGLVALKITGPSGHTSEPIKLMPMTMGMVKGFGAGVNLTEKGTYNFVVGSKLADGKKRQFVFSYTVI